MPTIKLKHEGPGNGAFFVVYGTIGARGRVLQRAGQRADDTRAVHAARSAERERRVLVSREDRRTDECTRRDSPTCDPMDGRQR